MKLKRENSKKRLYQKYLAEQQAEAEKENLGEELGIEQERIVVKKVSTIARIFEIAEDVFFILLKTAFYLVIMGLASLGFTVLMNHDLRVVVFDILSGYFR